MSISVVDSSAWVEYFAATEAGLKVKKIVEDGDNEIVTTVVTIAELSSFYKRNNIDFERPYNVIIKNSKIFQMDENVAKGIGEIHFEAKSKNKKFSFADSVVLYAAKKLKAKIITKDLDFKDFKETILI